MRERLGEEFMGVVTAVTGFGLFVTLESLYVEGLVHITELGAEYYRHDEARQELRGEHSGMRYTLGTRVRIQVTRVDLDGRRIDFRLVTAPHSGNRPLSNADKHDEAIHTVNIKSSKSSKSVKLPAPSKITRRTTTKDPSKAHNARTRRAKPSGA
jgi:ribonuclease R